MPTQQQQLEATLRAALKHRPELPVPTTTNKGLLAQRRPDTQAFILATERIRPDKHQVRRMNKAADDPAIRDLATSIEQFGLQNPIEVRWLENQDLFQLVSGERRFVAVTQVLGGTEIPVRVIDASEQDLVWLQLHENLHRADLHPIDLAAAVQTLIDGGTTLTDIARKLCKSKSYVQKALTIAKNLSEAAKTQMHNAPQITSLDIVYEVAQLPPPEQPKILQRIVAEGISRDQLRVLTAKAKEARKQASGSRRGRPTTPKVCRKTLKARNGATVTIQFRKARVTNQEIVAALRSALQQLAA